jgi:hypothetical protein
LKSLEKHLHEVSKVLFWARCFRVDDASTLLPRYLSLHSYEWMNLVSILWSCYMLIQSRWCFHITPTLSVSAFLWMNESSINTMIMLCAHRCHYRTMIISLDETISLEFLLHHDQNILILFIQICYFSCVLDIVIQ